MAGVQHFVEVLFAGFEDLAELEFVFVAGNGVTGLHESESVFELTPIQKHIQELISHLIIIILPLPKQHFILMLL